MRNILVGKTEEHLVSFQKNFLIHRDVASSLEKMFSTARAVRGFDLQIASSYRSFETQKKIWNEKATGLRPISGVEASDLKQMSPREIVFAILRWSAVPGASRHHWGTDFDFYDQSSMPGNYQLKLEPHEYSSRGIFADSSTWLTENMAEFGFFRPYPTDLGGIAPEPWHLSYRIIAEECLRFYTFEFFEGLLNEPESQFELISIVRENAREIYECFIESPAKV